MISSLLLSLVLGAAPLEVPVAHYQAGELEKARTSLEALLYPLKLEGEAHERDAHLLLAATYFALDDSGRAEEEVVRAFGVFGTAPVDPLLHPPDFQAFVDSVARRQGARILALSAERAATRVADPPASLVPVERPSLAWYPLPFGAGQFKNGQHGKGVALAVSQGLCAALSIASLATALSLRGSDGRYTAADAAIARPLNVVYLTGGYCFLGLYGYGVIDGIVNRR